MDLLKKAVMVTTELTPMLLSESDSDAFGLTRLTVRVSEAFPE